MLQNKRPGEKGAGQRISRQGINFASSYIPGLSACFSPESGTAEKTPPHGAMCYTPAILQSGRKAQRRSRMLSRAHSQIQALCGTRPMSWAASDL